MIEFLLRQDEVFSFQGFAGADEDFRLPIRVNNEYAWHNLFAHQMFIRPTEKELKNHNEQFTVISAPSFLADPNEDGTYSETFIVLSLKQRSEEHTSELQSRGHLVCRLLLEKKK